MENYQEIFILLTGFCVIALSSNQIGNLFAKIRLPKITGYLFAGLIAGPFVLGFFSKEAIEQLHFVDGVSLALIAFAAGNELLLSELKGKFKSIGWIAAGVVVLTFILVGGSVFLLANAIPFIAGKSAVLVTATAMLTGAILIARSPSSAIAVVSELRAKGPLTQVVLGVTVITDVIVIMVFALSASAVDALLAQVSLNLGFVLLLLGELVLAILAAFVVAAVLRLILAMNTNHFVKAILILLAGYSVFYLSAQLRTYSHDAWPFEIFVEPLLVCMLTGFLVTNFTNYRTEFDHILHKTGPFVYVAFFTLTGASLKLDVLLTIWPIALALFVVRLVAIIAGSFAGGVVAGDSVQHSRLYWMGLLTQAGVALGLAKEVAGEFPQLGNDFATMIIAVVVLNEIVGPIFLKYAINRAGEGHTRGETAEFDGIRDAIIFGVGGEAVTLARHLLAHDWQVKLACLDPAYQPELAHTDENLRIINIPAIDLESLQKLDTAHADAVVAMMSDEENYQICELVYEKFGIETVIVRLNDPANYDRFRDLDVIVVEPNSAVISLMERLVRSPSTGSLLLGMRPEQDIVEVELRDPMLNGRTLRDLRLPLDTLVLSVRRDDQLLITHGYTRLQLGDRVTIMGSQASLEEIMREFDS